MSSFEKIFALLTRSKVVDIFGKGYTFLTVTLFSIRKSVTIRNSPGVFFGTKNTGLPNQCDDGTMCPISQLSSIQFFNHRSASADRGYGRSLFIDGFGVNSTKWS
jgi:hypothetical protein